MMLIIVMHHCLPIARHFVKN